MEGQGYHLLWKLGRGLVLAISRQSAEGTFNMDISSGCDFICRKSSHFTECCVCFLSSPQWSDDEDTTTLTVRAVCSPGPFWPTCALCVLNISLFLGSDLLSGKITSVVAHHPDVLLPGHLFASCENRSVHETGHFSMIFWTLISVPCRKQRWL